MLIQWFKMVLFFPNHMPTWFSECANASILINFLENVYLFAVVFQFHIEVLKKQRELRGIQVSAMGSLFHFRSNAPSLLPLSDPAGPGQWERAVRLRIICKEQRWYFIIVRFCARLKLKLDYHWRWVLLVLLHVYIEMDQNLFHII